MSYKWIILLLISPLVSAQEQEGMCYYIYDAKGNLIGSTTHSPSGFVWPPIHEGVSLSQSINGRNVVARRDKCTRDSVVAGSPSALMDLVEKQESSRLIDLQKKVLGAAVDSARAQYVLRSSHYQQDRDLAMASVRYLDRLKKDVSDHVTADCLVGIVSRFTGTISLIKQATIANINSPEIAETMRSRILSNIEMIDTDILSVCDHR